MKYILLYYVVLGEVIITMNACTPYLRFREPTLDISAYQLAPHIKATQSVYWFLHIIILSSS